MKKALPRFITFEGSDGCGKTTQLQLLANRLRERGEVITQTKALGGTGTDFMQNALRSVLLDPNFPGDDVESEERLFAIADTRNLKAMQKVLSSTKSIVLQDRGQLSHVVYCVAKGMTFEEISEYQDFMHRRYRDVANTYGTLNVVLLAESERMVMERVISRGQTVTPRLENLVMQKAVLGTLSSISQGNLPLVNTLLAQAVDNVFVTVAGNEDIPTVEAKILAALRSKGYDV